MNTVVKSSNGITLVPDEAQLFTSRKVFIEGEINSASACEFVRKIMLLTEDDPNAGIDIYIDSPGGEVSAGLMIYDVIKGLSVEVRLFCIDRAASMAAIILAGGQKGRRCILPHSKVMIHEPLIAGGMGGSATSIRRTAESIMETKRITVELLAADTGKTDREVEEAISFDNYMNAEEAVAFGICDGITDSLV